MKDDTLLIAGPCSAESREQVLSTAKGLSGRKVDYFRAGIWKPRTLPGSFEGVGRTGLPWLKEVKETHGLKTCIEVADEVHVVEALKAGIDMLWIGARTSSNPFQVQRLADCLAGTDIPVAVKNPMNPDLALWSGAVERLARSGIKNLMAIHRGFAVYGQNHYRNAPLWQIPIDFRNDHPEIPLINDPSHICGRRDILADVAQMAMDHAFVWLMIETHPDPDVAWTDAAQQLTPDALHALLEGLVIREEGADYDALDSSGRRSTWWTMPSSSSLPAAWASVRESVAQRGITILQNKRWRDVPRRTSLRGGSRASTRASSPTSIGPSTGVHPHQKTHEEVKATAAFPCATAPGQTLVMVSLPSPRTLPQTRADVFGVSRQPGHVSLDSCGIHGQGRFDFPRGGGQSVHAMGAAHGGVYFKLIDDAAYFAAQAHVEDSYLLTVSMNLNFTRPVTGGRMVCRGQVLHRGRRMLVSEAELLDADGHLLATGRGTFMPSGKPLESDFGYR